MAKQKKKKEPRSRLLVFAVIMITVSSILYVAARYLLTSYNDSIAGKYDVLEKKVEKLITENEQAAKEIEIVEAKK